MEAFAGNQLPRLAALPSDGSSRNDVTAALAALATADREAVCGLRFARRFFSRTDVIEVASEAYGMFSQTVRASPYAGLPSPPSIATMQRDLEEAGLALLHAPPGGCAVVTSGGTESVVLAARACLAHAQRMRAVDGRAQVIAPWSAHPCIDKACDLLGLELVRVMTREDWRADIAAMETAITPRTVMLYGSYPSYSYGIEDDIEALGLLARSHGLWLHVDACMSGFLAPFLRMNGKIVPDFDFRVPGVSSISADLHKHGYSAKGASMLLFRSSELGEGHFFRYTDYPLPPMTTPTLAGTAAGAPIASAWAAMRYLGVSGYRELARQVDESREAIAAAAKSVAGFEVLGQPRFSLLIVTSQVRDMGAVHRGLNQRQWFTLPVHRPPGIHINVSASDAEVAPEFARALSEVSATDG